MNTFTCSLKQAVAEAMAAWDERCHTSAIDFGMRREAMPRQRRPTGRSDYHYEGEYVLSGGRILGNFPSDQVIECLSAMTPDNCILVWESKKHLREARRRQSRRRMKAIVYASPCQSRRRYLSALSG